MGLVAPNAKFVVSAQASAYKIFKLIDTFPEINCFSSTGITPTDFRGKIQFLNVTFSYPTRKDVNVLEGFNLTIEEGQTIALVGNVLSCLQSIGDC